MSFVEQLRQLTDYEEELKERLGDLRKGDLNRAHFYSREVDHSSFEDAVLLERLRCCAADYLQDRLNKTSAILDRCEQALRPILGGLTDELVR